MRCSICVDGNGKYFAEKIDGRKKAKMLVPMPCPICKQDQRQPEGAGDPK